MTVAGQGAPTAVPPYPLNASHPMPQAMQLPPGPGFAPGGYQTGPYPVHTAPYPPAPGELLFILVPSKTNESFVICVCSARILSRHQYARYLIRDGDARRRLLAVFELVLY